MPHIVTPLVHPNPPHTPALFSAAGHSGPDYFHAQPINDVWKFSLHSGRWEEVAQQGPVPLPRFEEAYVQYTPSGEEGARVCVCCGVCCSMLCQRRCEGAAPRSCMTGTRMPPLVEYHTETRPCPPPLPAPALADSRLLVFGGQTFGVCQLNDVFELDLTRLVWKELSPPRWCTAKCRRAHERG